MLARKIQGFGTKMIEIGQHYSEEQGIEPKMRGVVRVECAHPRVREIAGRSARCADREHAAPTASAMAGRSEMELAVRVRRVANATSSSGSAT